MSHEHRLEIPTTSISTFLQSDSMTTSNFEKESRLGLEAFKEAFQYVKGSEDEAASLKVAQKYASAFDAGMPGLITTNELAAKEDLLGQWMVSLGDVIVTLEVKAVPKQDKIQSPTIMSYLGPRNLGRV